jgi:hypothetical protein
VVLDIVKKWVVWSYGLLRAPNPRIHRYHTTGRFAIDYALQAD